MTEGMNVMASAKTLTDTQLLSVLDYTQTTSKDPLRDAVAVLFSFKAGLRVAEIAGLSWRDVTDATNAIADVIELPNAIAKKGSGRIIPMHPALKAALIAWQRHLGPSAVGKAPVIPGAFGGRMKANTLQIYLGRMYRDLGLCGVSSHSGRRTFITKAARAANAHGCSIRDVQSLAGHKYLDTTEAYIDRSARVASLVEAV